MKGERPAAVVVALLGSSEDIAAELDEVAFVQALGVADEGLPAAQVDPLVERSPQFRRAAPALKLGGNHAGVVEHQHVARAQQARQVAHGQVSEGPLPWHVQQARGIARARRAQGDPFGRKLEIEAIDAHWRGISWPEELPEPGPEQGLEPGQAPNCSACRQ